MAEAAKAEAARTVPMKRAYKRAPAEEEELNDTDKLKIAFWFIGKCGSVDDALRVLRAAVAAQEVLSGSREDATPGGAAPQVP